MKDEIIKQIWALSPEVQLPGAYHQLQGLTVELSSHYRLEGRLTSDPFLTTRERVLSLPLPELHDVLEGSTCIVTGGLGCVGTVLVNELLKFNVKQIVILDIQQGSPFASNPIVTSLCCDIRNLEKLLHIFSIYRPNLVFHLAAIRDPGFAESHARETVTTNVLGTVNVIRACESVDTVEQMVYSSTGKASRYFTEEVYAASKKVTEFVVDAYARGSQVKYSMVRFTHILNNSLMNEEIKRKSLTANFISIHSPNKYVTAQNATEAAQLMFNALVFSKRKQCRLLLVRHLEWPVESLEVALFHIQRTGRKIPIIFVGNPHGYSEKFFRGQFDWTHPEDLNLLINVYEKTHAETNPFNDVIISRACPVDRLTIDSVLFQLSDAREEPAAKIALVKGLATLVRESLKMVNAEQTVSILRAGLDHRYLTADDHKMNDFGPIVPLLVESLAGTSHYNEVEDLVCQTA